MKFIQAYIKKFMSLTSGGLIWHLTSTDTKRHLELTTVNSKPSTRFIHAILLKLSCLQGFQTSIDLKQPLTSSKNNRSCTMVGALSIYEVHLNFSAEIIMFSKISDFDLSWPQVTLSPLHWTILLLLLLIGINMPCISCMKSIQIELLKFKILAAVDLNWPLT